MYAVRMSDSEKTKFSVWAALVSEGQTADRDLCSLADSEMTQILGAEIGGNPSTSSSRSRSPAGPKVPHGEDPWVVRVNVVVADNHDLVLLQVSK